jgi:pyruvate/2-oxoglutarate dehydrogenase complex dihydrolipoamide acyltransferase (E2) component
MIEVRLPQWSMSMTEGTIVEWYYEVGDDVVEDQPIAEVEADKVNSEIFAPATGRFSAIFFQDGDTVPVMTVLAHIEPT